MCFIFSFVGVPWAQQVNTLSEIHRQFSNTNHIKPPLTFIKCLCYTLCLSLIVFEYELVLVTAPRRYSALLWCYRRRV